MWDTLSLGPGHGTVCPTCNDDVLTYLGVTLGSPLRGRIAKSQIAEQRSRAISVGWAKTKRFSVDYTPAALLASAICGSLGMAAIRRRV
jgi:hypothetical protein